MLVQIEQWLSALAALVRALFATNSLFFFGTKDSLFINWTPPSTSALIKLSRAFAKTKEQQTGLRSQGVHEVRRFPQDINQDIQQFSDISIIRKEKSLAH